MVETAMSWRPRNGLNVALCAAIPASMLTLLAVASQVSLWWSPLIGIVFSLLMLTNYALMHEAAHSYLHSNRSANALLGSFTALHFPMSGRFFALTHQVHHRCNRTDHEMFDYYYPGDNLFIKYCQWYGILSGLHYLIVPLGSVIAALVPAFYRLKIFKRSRSSGVLFDDLTGVNVWYIRAEVIIGIVYWMTIWQLLGLQWQAVAILYAIAGFHWSTRQYLTHAFTPRDVRNGAIILKSGRLMRAVLLNGNFDLVHHRQPEIPWSYLSEHVPTGVEPVPFWRQYLAMWKGPRPNTEVAPLPERA